MATSHVTVAGAGGNSTVLAVGSDARSALANAIKNLVKDAGKHSTINEIASGVAGKSGIL